MSAKVETKKFGKGERSVPHHSEKAQKWYPAEDDAQPRKVRFDCTPGTSRLSYLVRSGMKIERAKASPARDGIIDGGESLSRIRESTYEGQVAPEDTAT